MTGDEWSASRRGRLAHDFGDVLRFLRPVLPCDLFCEGSWRDLIACAEDLPVSVADSLFGFEFRLGAPRPGSDLLFSIRPHSHLSEHYIGVGAEARGGPPAALAGFLSEMNRSDSFLARYIAMVALEYDVASAGVGDLAAPGVFLCRSGGDVPAPGRRRPNAGVLVASLSHAVGTKEDSFVRRGVERICDALPAGCDVRWVGAFPGRRPQAVRPVLHEPGSDVDGFLARIGWNGDRATAGALARAFGRHGAGVSLCLDALADGLSPRIGLEISRRGKVDRGGWSSILDGLVERAWCLPSTAAALLGCCGAERIFDGDTLSEVYRGMNHVKISIDRDEVTAKGYLVYAMKPMS